MSKGRKRRIEHTVETVQTTTADLLTGEIKKDEKKQLKRRRVNNDNFFMVYLMGLPALMNLSGTEIKVLLYLAGRTNYEQNTVMLHPKEKEELCRLIGVNKRTIEDATRSLVASGIMTGARNAYTLSPDMFWRGEIQARIKLLEGIEKEEERFVMPKSEEFTD